MFAKVIIDKFAEKRSPEGKKGILKKNTKQHFPPLKNKRLNENTKLLFSPNNLQLCAAITSLTDVLRQLF